MNKVICICGKICSGKTYYANLLKEKNNAVILSTDEVTYDLTNNKQGEDYNEFAKKVNLYLRKKAKEIANAGTTVILDWGFWTKSEREDISNYFKSNNINVEFHYLDLDDQSLKQNIIKRNKQVLDGNGGPSFYVDDNLFNKVESLFEVPLKNEIDVWIKPNK